MRKLIQAEFAAITTINPDENTFIISYVVGLGLPERGRGKVLPLAGTGTEWVWQNRVSLLILEHNREEIVGRLPGLLPLFKAGIRSIMMIPLKSEDRVIGALVLHTTTQNAYTQADLKLAERVSTQIAGAIANAQLYRELAAGEATVAAEKKKAEELEALNQQLRASEQQLRTSEQQLKGANQQLEAKEQALQKSQTELKEKLAEVERFNKAMVGRELTMIKLKEEINSLLEEMGKTKKY
jgi:transcriptional regulator with GAF, ATPase, and Fis domain